MAEEYYWVITGSETVMLRQTRLQCVGACSCTRLIDHMCFEIRLSHKIPEPSEVFNTLLSTLYLHAHLSSYRKHSCQQLARL